MAENKIAKIPVASHGLHRHNYNYPWLSSINFGDVMPCYYNPIRKGERDNPNAGLFSQLMPIAHNAFATGRFNFKAIFVPYKLVWRHWYYFDQQTEWIQSTGVSTVPTRYPYVTHGALSFAFVKNYCIAGTQDVYDLIYAATGGATTPHKVKNDAGRRILRILGALGSVPSFIVDDSTPLNILPILCYLKAFADYYFPNNYVSDSHYRTLTQFFENESIGFDNYVDVLLEAIEIASVNFYENTVFDLAWDKPTSPNVNSNNPVVSISDISNDAEHPMVVTNDPSGVVTPSNDGFKPSNGTPFVGGSYQSTSSPSNTAYGVFTKYVFDALTAVSLWAKRRQLSGARLLDRFLVSRGINLPNDSAKISYFLGQRNVEIEVSGVENNTDYNLGELAGRGVASSGDKPLSFECSPDDDGIFFVIVSPIPDANFPIYLDGFVNRRDFLDNYTAEYDKLGSAAVPCAVVQGGLNGAYNNTYKDRVFGFLNQYWDEVQEKPRLLGDFMLWSRGAAELSAYHTFRLLRPDVVRVHSYDFIRMTDAAQFNRLFYSADQENLMLFLRWYGSQYKEKLPLGDSYDWDDDELNRKVDVVVGGSQK